MTTQPAPARPAPLALRAARRDCPPVRVRPIPREPIEAILQIPAPPARARQVPRERRAHQALIAPARPPADRPVVRAAQAALPPADWAAPAAAVLKMK